MVDRNKEPSGDKPTVGSSIYVGSAWYIDHGEDDFQGGKCTISRVSSGISAGNPTWFVEVAERPGYSYNYLILLESQAKWAETYGDRAGYPDPDYG